ncbi:MAG: Holliday junction branch migration protein RuvA [Lachnospiraceae bacterium]|nr:Holliday junction branch migration protein RuvA [Lachnospiraceae bacterium]
MVAYVKGKLAETGQDHIVLDIGNMGINIRVSDGFLTELPPVGTDMKVHTYTYVKEDAFLLYGFATREELELFQMMITVNGIGPKGALAILSIMSATDLRFAIFSSDVKAISRANGIGKKTAERLILDLRDKIDIEQTLQDGLEEIAAPVKGANELGQNRKDAIDALVALGYGMTEAAKAVKQVDVSGDPTADEILKASLKYLL